MLKKILSYVFPQTLHITSSKFNSEITVQKQFGKNLLYVNQTQQSGSWEEKIWNKALLDLRGLVTNSHRYGNILILGLGAGNLAKLINKKYPTSKIIGVEIDPEIIKIGKQYFALNTVPNLQIICSSGNDYINSTSKKYDLIFVDLFIGKNYPPELSSDIFLNNLSQTLSKNGVVVFNRLTSKNGDFEARKFIDKLAKFYKIEQTSKVDFNLIFFCSRKR